MDKFDTVLSGAGVSMAAPTRLQNGDQLTTLAWNSIVNSCNDSKIEEYGNFAIHHIQDRNNFLRLEQLLEVVSHAVGMEKIYELFQYFDDYPYNFNHAALACSGIENQFTLNFDTLLESAYTDFALHHDVVHLHGRHDIPESISATIGQYLQGLDIEMESTYRKAIEGKRVLVMGYSGRDCDVLPLFLKYPPAYIHWIKFPGATLYENVENLRSDLQKLLNINCEFIVDEITIEAFLYRMLSEMGLMNDKLTSLYTHSHEKENEFRIHPKCFTWDLASLPTKICFFAAMLVFFDLGMYKEQISVMENKSSLWKHDFYLSKTIARAYKNTGNYRQAYQLFSPMPPNIKQLTWRIRNINEIANLLPTIGKSYHAALLDNILIIMGTKSFNRELAKTAMFARVRRARRKCIYGNLTGSVSDLQVVFARDNIKSLLTLGGIVDAYIWEADVYKKSGNYEAALRSAKNAIDESVYSNSQQHIYAIWRLAEIQLILGEDEAVVIENLDKAMQMARNSRNKKAIFWIAVTYGSIYGTQYKRRVKRNLKKAERLLPWDTIEGKLYYLLQTAERARVFGHYSKCLDIVKQVLSEINIKKTFPWGHKPAKLAAQLILAECKRVSTKSEDDKNGARASLLKVLHECEKTGFRGIAARAEVSIAILDNSEISPVRINTFIEQGWKLEAKRAADMYNPNYEPWIIIM